jgi:hypothetical protein
MRGLAVEELITGRLLGHVVDLFTARTEVVLGHVHTEDVALEVITAITLPAPVLRVLRVDPQVQTMALQKQPTLIHPFS